MECHSALNKYLRPIVRFDNLFNVYYIEVQIQIRQ